MYEVNEKTATFYYHTDHLGSASLITDYKGNEFQRIEYTPYGETWVEKHNIINYYMPYKFTGKEKDEETGLYYYGARYLDPKYSLWKSTDPALSEYMSGSDAGEGGVYNHINLNLYHYAGNNPINYIDPDGRYQIPVYGNIVMQDSEWRREKLKGTTTKFKKAGCAVIAVADLLGETPVNVNKNYVTNGSISWADAGASKNWEVEKVTSAFTKETFETQQKDTKFNYRTLISVNWTDGQKDDHWVPLQDIVTLKVKVTVDGKEVYKDVDYAVISPTSIYDRLAGFSKDEYFGQEFPEDKKFGYSEDRKNKGWRIINGKIYVPLSETRGYVNFKEAIPEKTED